MPYVTPPTFTNGNVLSASQLNILSDDIEYLYGVVRQTNAATQMVELVAQSGLTTTATKWSIRHRTNTLRYRMDVVQGTVDGVRIKFGSTTVYNNADDHSNPYTYNGTADLSSFGLTMGQWYIVTVEVDGEPGSSNNTLRVLDIREIA